MSKRSIEELLEDVTDKTKKTKMYEHVKKHTLDSEEEDSDVDEDRYNVLDEEDIQGEEDGVSKMDGEVKLTPFNMKEELEEGHFDGDGHFQWNKNKEIKDHWLDNLDRVKIKQQKEGTTADNKESNEERGLADSSSDSEDSDGDDEDGKKFDVIAAYRRILELMEPKETIKRTLQRLGRKSANISSIERFRRKKAGIVDENAKLVTELTELTNKILTKLGNMDIYQETYEQINAKFGSKLKSGLLIEDNDALDMYADDFDKKEQNKITSGPSSVGQSTSGVATASTSNDQTDGVQWEYKWKQNDVAIHGPFPTEQMQKWVIEGYFKDGVFVRKVGSDTQFNSSNRIDFELYL